jgi:hypothetical protein
MKLSCASRRKANLSRTGARLVNDVFESYMLALMQKHRR